MPKCYSVQDVAKHNIETDLWVIIDGDVYDVTKFINEHPGGRNPFIYLAGKDASETFHKISSHDDEVEILLEAMKVGVIVDS